MNIDGRIKGDVKMEAKYCIIHCAHVLSEFMCANLVLNEIVLEVRPQVVIGS